MKILNILNKYSKKLENKNFLTPKLDIKILLSCVINVKTNSLYLYFDKELNKRKYKKFYYLFRKRLKNEPIANIIKKKEFWNYNFYVNKNVLTPRNDSEILIQAILNNYKNKNEKFKILDLGTGSGCLILTLLKLYKKSFGIGVDISNKALKVAKKNAKNLKIKNIKFIQNNWNDNINEKFDIIISNPPYIPQNTIKTLDLEVQKYNPIISLNGGTDGLLYYRYLAKNIFKNFKENTKLFLEIGINQKTEIEKIFNKYDFKINNVYKDYSNIERILEIIKINH